MSFGSDLITDAKARKVQKTKNRYKREKKESFGARVMEEAHK